MMSAILRSVESSAVIAEPQWLAALRRLRRALLRALDGLAPVRPPAQYRDLPEEWYDQPPL
jgi:hypothetical protein